MNVGITFYNVFFFFASVSKLNTSKRPLLDVERNQNVHLPSRTYTEKDVFTFTEQKGKCLHVDFVGLNSLDGLSVVIMKFYTFPPRTEDRYHCGKSDEFYIYIIITSCKRQDQYQ